MKEKFDLLTFSRIFVHYGFEVTIAFPEKISGYKELTIKISDTNEYDYFPKFIMTYDIDPDDPQLDRITEVVKSYIETAECVIVDILKRILPEADEKESKKIMEEVLDQYSVIDDLSDAADACKNYIEGKDIIYNEDYS